jgi:hypothetical protein
LGAFLRAEPAKTGLSAPATDGSVIKLYPLRGWVYLALLTVLQLDFMLKQEAVAKLKFSTANIPGKCFGSL